MALTQLNAASAGISRLRTKGGPKPDTLYDLLNGFVDASGAINSRPGTEIDYSLPSGSIDMCAFDGGLVVFSHEIVPDMPEGVTCEVLTHPEDPEIALVKIHFAGPFLGYLYVTAEFEDGNIYDFWLQSAQTWQSNTVYTPSDLVQPTIPNGFVYRPHRISSAGVIWSPGERREIGEVVEPTVFNGFDYIVVEAHGSPPRSGDVEPQWPVEEGQVVVEEADVPVAPPPSQTQPPPSVPPRYGNPGGSTPRHDSGSWQVQ